MTATAAVLPAALSRATSSHEPREDASSAGHFDKQLNAARQKQAPKQDRTDHASDKQQASVDHADSSAKRAASDADAAASASAKATSDAATRAKHADDDKTTDDDTPAAALASSMLALLGPSQVTLRPVAAGIAAAGAGGKTVAGDASAAALLSMNTAAVGANAMAAALPPGAGLMLAANNAKPAAIEKATDLAAQPTAALALPTATTQSTQSVQQLQIPTPVGSHGFAQELGQHVAWMGSQDVKQARIRLHPDDMGQLDIKVSVNHGRVDVVFNAQHPGAATAVQQSLPQLDQMLSQHGLSLGHADVSQHDRGTRDGGNGGHADGSAIDEVGEIHSVTASSGSVSLLDAFA